MIRAVAALAACALFLVPVLTAPARVVAAVAGAGFVLAGAGVVAGWPQLVAAAAAMFVLAYATALALSPGGGHLVAAAGFGLSLLVLLQSADLARAARTASIGPGVARARLGAWAVLGGGALAAAMLGTVAAGGLAGLVPHAVAPLLTAAGALGVVLALGAIMIHGSRAARAWWARSGGA
ncbi:MAG TPA: hypothetical protein VMT79_07330 [Candidatus Binatia bacterium]|nr:hypothetical protein [Candidatus Binatia bacterium]